MKLTYNPKYQKQIDRLTQNPHLIHKEWRRAVGIFGFACPKRKLKPVKAQELGCGCLTQISCTGPGRHAFGERGVLDKDWKPAVPLTERIKRDRFLPRGVQLIKSKHLKRLAYYATLIDKVTGRR